MRVLLLCGPYPYRVLMEAVGSVGSHHSRSFASHLQVQGLGSQNPAVPAFVLEKDHPRNGGCLNLVSPNLVTMEDRDLKKHRRLVQPERGRQVGLKKNFFIID